MYVLHSTNVTPLVSLRGNAGTLMWMRGSGARPPISVDKKRKKISFLEFRTFSMEQSAKKLEFSQLAHTRFCMTIRWTHLISFITNCPVDSHVFVRLCEIFLLFDQISILIFLKKCVYVSTSLRQLSATLTSWERNFENLITRAKIHSKNNQKWILTLEPPPATPVTWKYQQIIILYKWPQSTIKANEHVKKTSVSFLQLTKM